MPGVVMNGVFPSPYTHSAAATGNCDSTITEKTLTSLIHATQADWAGAAGLVASKVR